MIFPHYTKNKRKCGRYLSLETQSTCRIKISRCQCTWIIFSNDYLRSHCVTSLAEIMVVVPCGRSQSLDPEPRARSMFGGRNVSTRLLHRRPSLTGIDIPSSQDRHLPKRSPFSLSKDRNKSVEFYQMQICRQPQKIPVDTDCPIHSLPEEILLWIFDICVQYHRPWPYWPSKLHRTPPTTLSAVCKYWRRIAILAPLLWTKFDLHISKSVDTQPQWVLQAYLERSGRLPLSFVYRYLDEENSSGASLHATYRLLSRRKNLRRWKQVMIEAPFFHDGWILSHIKAAALHGCLQDVSLASNPYDWRFVLPGDETGRSSGKRCIQWSSRLGNLRSLSMHIPVEVRIKSLSRYLEHLQLVFGVSGRFVSRLLRYLPNLRSCRIAVVDTPSPRLTPVKHHFLQDLEIFLGGVRTEAFDRTVEAILSSWEFPALKRLVLSDTLRDRFKTTFEPPWEGVFRRFNIGYRSSNLGITDFLKRSFTRYGNTVKLETLGIFETLLDPYDIVEILEMCPLLQEFAYTDIHEPRESTSRDAVRLCCDGGIGFSSQTFTGNLPVGDVLDIIEEIYDACHGMVVMFYHESLNTEQAPLPACQAFGADFPHRKFFVHSPLHRFKTYWDKECLCTFCGGVTIENRNTWLKQE